MFISILLKLEALTEGELYNQISSKIKEYFNLENVQISNFLRKKIDFNITIQQNKKYFVRIIFFDLNEFEEFGYEIFRKVLLKEIIELDNISFKILSILTSEKQSKWCKKIDLENIIPKFEYNYQIFTPAFFKLGDTFLKEIDKHILIKKLLKDFNKKTPYKINLNINNFLNSIEIEQNTKQLKFNGGTGIKGNFKLILKENYEEFSKKFTILNNFALLNGIGINTEKGYGAIIEKLES
ncbi:MAG: CRISPR-associated endoribonuclease Cas6 [Fusobacteriaceae bacterium]|jgi:hypothetical protein|nr:CRISPR-associated endoribonuclease Cas6 [Fusobacteriales bacterium]MDN5305166.1 CRISPR-associated endoribonuclease Cas6 [Fusobacteriaceae bacterium]